MLVLGGGIHVRLFLRRPRLVIGSPRRHRAFRSQFVSLRDCQREWVRWINPSTGSWTLSALPDMPTYAGQIDEMDFRAPREIGRRFDPKSRVFMPKLQPRYGLPPDGKVRHVQPDHKVLGKCLHIVLLQNELRTTVAEARIAVAF